MSLSTLCILCFFSVKSHVDVLWLSWSLGTDSVPNSHLLNTQPNIVIVKNKWKLFAVWNKQLVAISHRGQRHVQMQLSQPAIPAGASYHRTQASPLLAHCCCHSSAPPELLLTAPTTAQTAQRHTNTRAHTHKQTNKMTNTRKGNTKQERENHEGEKNHGRRKIKWTNKQFDKNIMVWRVELLEVA